jgi:hypothetical protein
LQKPVGFAPALAVSRLAAAKYAFLSGCSFKTEVLKEPLIREEINRKEIGKKL